MSLLLSEANEAHKTSVKELKSEATERYKIAQHGEHRKVLEESESNGRYTLVEIERLIQDIIQREREEIRINMQSEIDILTSELSSCRSDLEKALLEVIESVPISIFHRLQDTIQEKEDMKRNMRSEIDSVTSELIACRERLDKALNEVVHCIKILIFNMLFSNS